MSTKSLENVPDAEVLRGLEALSTQSQRRRKLIAAHLAEIKDRELYKEAGYDSIEAYCEGELGLSMEDLDAPADLR